MDPILTGFIVYLLVVLVVGVIAYRQTRSQASFILGDRKLGPWVIALSERASGESAFIWLLGFAGLSGLLLYAVRGTDLTGLLLALHLGSVLAFFLLTPYSKMAHGFFRFAALMRDAQTKRG